ncbi:MAG: alpha/beta fold hydrolase [Microthrixaceae bacterium]
MITDVHGLGGIRLAADVDGPEGGPTVVLLHGGGQTRHSWSGTYRVLVDAGWRALSLDMRGHGDSAWPPDHDYSLEAFSGDVAAVSSTLDQPPVLVGASLGGISSMVAVADAEVQSEVARALVLVDVSHRVEDSGRERIVEFMTDHLDGFASLEDAADAVAAYNPHRPRPSDLDGLRKNLRQNADGRWFWHWDPAFVAGPQGSADETRTSVVDPARLSNAADALAIPTLLVRGRQSDLLSEEGVADFLARVPTAEFADVAGAGHMVAGDRNEVFNTAILEFLERHRD